MQNTGPHVETLIIRNRCSLSLSAASDNIVQFNFSVSKTTD
jgi:hypothetical protein